ncbi:sulfoxide reductase heme-binding subunit YedZ [Marinobacter gudaonensis]|uniref:Protein-methionine-sulfoxide reductase heme-binding subunit MsrQ n=1 Tax=Marinobacter gudaonensis TaxID=375760 RepID=A0A1I6I2X5_9GAMM|nr:protein-methionine-sulfoxide reductase heme-binding subunit MsrQ [Marinobacter gudaonensis]SFR61009.1 sulfoxide reductase heme-binding subunit YedZ [Marinobacter gudaonensis]
MSTAPGASRSAALLAFRLAAATLASMPLLLVVLDIINQSLGPDPGQEVTETLGLAAFQLLLATLFMTPLQRWTGWSGWLRIRRMLGLFAFFYASLHVLAFLQFILGWNDLWATFTKRPYVIAGAVSFLLLVPLAATSTRWMMKKLGRQWKPLHRSIYPAVVIAWLHFIWQARSDVGEMVVYGVIVLGLLALRWRWFGPGSLIPFKRA